MKSLLKIVKKFIANKKEEAKAMEQQIAEIDKELEELEKYLSPELLEKIKSEIQEELDY